MKRIFLVLKICTLAALIQSCGVAIHSSSHEVVYDDYVSFSIYEITPRGSLDFIYGDCINLDDPLDATGSVHIDTPYVGEDLYMAWDNFRGALDLTFEDDFHLIHATSFSTQYFRSGNEAEFSIGTDFSDYLIEFSGPFCQY